jgi:glycosyltransferase involved in cell wall biosynthesis
VARICVLLNKDFSHQTRLIREHATLRNAGYEISVVCAMDTPGKPVYETLESGDKVCRLLKKRLYKYHLFSLRLVKSFFRVVKNHPRSDYVHVHDPSVLLLGWLLARVWGAKLVYDAHEYWDALFDEEEARLKANASLKPAECARKLCQLEWTRRFETWVLPHCDAVISVNDSIGERMQQKVGGRIRRYLTLRNFAMRREIERSRRLHEYFGLPESTKIVLYQGQIAEKRGLGKAVEAMKHLSDLDLRLVLIGPVLPADEAFFNKILADVEQSELKGRVLYKGFAPPNELLQWTASADLGLQPIINCNMNHYLCLPNKIFEYIQAGLPIAASAFPELKNIVEGYSVGLTFDPDNPADIAEKIRRFFDSPELQEQCRENLQRAKQELCWEVEEQKLADLYRSF